MVGIYPMRKEKDRYAKVANDGKSILKLIDDDKVTITTLTMCKGDYELALQRPAQSDKETIEEVSQQRKFLQVTYCPTVNLLQLPLATFNGDPKGKCPTSSRLR
uniref:ADF-H domain-containing protein n=1 Tax=Loa loa TaxID=7209 RepID=A0A1I7VVM3_LOALO